MKKLLAGLVFIVSFASNCFADFAVHWHDFDGPRFKVFEKFDDASELYIDRVRANQAALLTGEDLTMNLAFGAELWLDRITGNAILQGHLHVPSKQTYYVVQARPGISETIAASDSHDSAKHFYDKASPLYAKALIENGRVIEKHGIDIYVMSAVGVWARTFGL